MTRARTILDYLDIALGLIAFLLGFTLLLVPCLATRLLDAISRPFIPSRSYQSRLYSEYSWDGK